ncbi:hypothetical protein AgCh_021782 [Apium graveolens]
MYYVLIFEYYGYGNFTGHCYNNLASASFTPTVDPLDYFMNEHSDDPRLHEIIHSTDQLKTEKYLGLFTHNTVRSNPEEYLIECRGIGTEIFMPKSIQYIDVILEDTDIAKSLTEYVNYTAIENLVLGAGKDPALLAQSREFLKDVFEAAEILKRDKEEILAKLSEAERLVGDSKSRVNKVEEDNAKLRRALEQSMTRLNRMSMDSDYFVDRRIVIKLLVTYFQRNHSKEGTESIKKNRKTILTQEYEHFDSKPDESLTGLYDRFVKLLNVLSLVDKEYDLEDSNLKFMVALPESWDLKATTIRDNYNLEETTLDEI